MAATEDAPTPNREASTSESDHPCGHAEQHEHDHDHDHDHDHEHDHDSGEITSYAARLWGTVRTAFHGEKYSTAELDVERGSVEQESVEQESVEQGPLERGALERGSAKLESAKYSIHEMTCGNCERKLSSSSERKLKKALSRLTSIRNPRINLSRQELQFEVDPEILSPDDAALQLKTITGLRFTKLMQIDEVYLDVQIDDWESFERRPRPKGVLNVHRLHKSGAEKCSVRIQYDPTQVHPRDLLQQGYGIQEIHLDPVPIDLAARNDKQLIRKEASYTIASVLLTVPILVFEWAPVPKLLPYRAAGLGLATIVQFAIGWEFYPSAFKSLFLNKTIEMDLLIVISTSIAYLFSVLSFTYFVKGVQFRPEAFFETSALLITLIRMGRFFCALARRKANDAVSIQVLQPTKALLVDKNDKYRPIGEVDVRLMQPGDVFEVGAGCRIPTDGEVVHGSGRVDESSMTGESDLPVKGDGKQVIAGTMVKSGVLRIVAGRLVCKNRISEISRLMKEIDLSKTDVKNIADDMAGIFVPLILAHSCLIFLIWLFWARYGNIGEHTWHESAIMGFDYAIAILIVACPCAIGLAVPMVVVIAQGVAVRHNLVFRAPWALQDARKTTHVVFDKTGTLTGDFSVSHQHYLQKVAPKERVDSLLAGLISNSFHPVDRALQEYLEDSAPATYSTITQQTGCGIIGVSDGDVVQIGKHSWLGLPEPEREHSTLPCSFTAMKLNDELCAEFQLSTALCPEAKGVITGLKSRGIIVEILSGDSVDSTTLIANELDVEFNAEQTPEQKQRHIAEIQKKDKEAVVMFIGDGTNDALALAQANVSVAVKGGTDVALSAADIVLTERDLRGILVAIDISAAATRRIVFNFIWSAVYNLGAILLAGGSFTGISPQIRIAPAYAGLGELISVLPVILVAFSLTFIHFRARG